ncbi:MAG: hydrolase [Phototrophicales bacterium]|nr:MAG: hydrolase [Phototrophicales bacterium]
MTLLLKNATLLTMTTQGILHDHGLVIEGNHIVALGPSQQLVQQYPSAEVIDVEGGVVMPGGICAHTHFYGAYARGMSIPGIPPKDFPEILARLWWPLDKALDAETIRYSALVCLVDAIKHGTTCLIDHHASPNHIKGSLDIIADAVDSAGLRAVLCYEVSDRDGIEKAQAGIAENVRFIESAKHRERIAATFGLHASLTLSEKTLTDCVEAARALDVGFHIHVAEHEADQYDSLYRYGQRVVHRLEAAGILGEKTIVAHAVHCDAWELEVLRDTGTWVTHQPRSNMNNAVGAAPIDTMLRGGIKVCLGNDGFSNNMWAEWKAAYLLHKVVNRDPRCANGADIAKMATEHNALLAQTFFPNERLGVLAEGALADVIVVDYYPYTPLTNDNWAWHILFGFESSMVRTTIVDGRVLMHNRQVLVLDERQVMAEALKLAPSLWARYQTLAQ